MVTSFALIDRGLQILTREEADSIEAIL